MGNPAKSTRTPATIAAQKRYAAKRVEKKVMFYKAKEAELLAFANQLENFSGTMKALLGLLYHAQQTGQVVYIVPTYNDTPLVATQSSVSGKSSKD